MHEERWASADEHLRYPRRIESLKRCRHGDPKCGKRVTHGGFANGLAMTEGCEWHVYQWVADRLAFPLSP